MINDNDEDAFLDDCSHLGLEEIDFISYVFLTVTFHCVAFPALTSSVVIVWVGGAAVGKMKREMNLNMLSSEVVSLLTRLLNYSFTYTDAQQ